MKKNNFKIFGIIFLLSAIGFGQVMSSGSVLQPSSEQSMLLGSIKYGRMQDEFKADSIDFTYEKSPGLAFLMSIVLPGAGEFYSGKKMRALGFFGAEALFWAGYFSQKNKGQNIKDKYENYADENWSLAEWLTISNTNDYSFCGIEGSHSIWVEYNNNAYMANDSLEFYTGKNTFELINLAENGQLTPVKTRDYYENIGKYHQFSCGWDDFKDFHSVGDTVCVVSDNRDYYLSEREKSNKSLKMATNFATAVMFNHLFSALHAQIAAKQYRSEEASKVSWDMGLMTDVRYKNFVRGVKFSLLF